MRRTLSICALGLALTATSYLAPSTAHAGRDMRGRFGLGGGRNLSGAYQLKGKYFVNNKFSIGLGIGASYLKVGAPAVGSPKSVFLTAISPEFIGWIRRTAEQTAIAANFGIGGRLNIVAGRLGAPAPAPGVPPVPGAPEPKGTTLWEVAVEVPVIAEVYFGYHFAVAPEAGLVMRVAGNSKDKSVDVGGPNNAGPGLKFTNNFGAFAGLSFYFFF